MASKGSFNTTGYSGGDGELHLIFEWSIKSQDIATNKTVINWSLKGAGDVNGYYKAGGFKVIINGATVYSKSTDYRIELYAGTVVASGTATIPHNTDGTKKFSASAKAGIYYYAVNCTGSGSWDLTSIPRYATVKQVEGQKTETDIEVEWSSDSVIDYLWYSTNNGSNWTGVNVADGKSGNYTITGLTPNTTYKIKTRVRRKDSQLKTDSSTLTVTTYNYPHCTKAPAFKIGDPVTLEFYNPLYREFTFYIVCNGVQIKNNWTIADKEYYGLGTQSTQNQLYETIPNDPEAFYQVKVVYGDSTIIYDSPNKISVDTAKCLPIFNAQIELTDKNPNTMAVTRNASIVKDYSVLFAGINGKEEAVATNYATITHYTFTVDTLSQTVPYTQGGVNATLGVIRSAGAKRLTVRAHDSRGLSSAVYRDITVYDYEKPVIYADIKRLNNFEAQTTIKISGKYSRLTINGTDKNTIKAVNCRYREIDGEWIELDPLAFTTETASEFVCADVYLNLDISKSFEFEITAEDKLDATTLPATVDVGQAIFFISSNKKRCYINGVEVPNFDTLYPVGSIFCNSTNTNPSELYGGEWELIDKGFKASTTDVVQEATEYLSKFEVTSMRGGNTIRFRISLTTAKEINDSTATLGTVDLAEHGLYDDGAGFFTYNAFGQLAMSDSAHAVILAYFMTNGNIQTVDCLVGSGTHVVPAGSPFYLNVVMPVAPSNMLDTFCDKFYFKRIA